MAPLFVERTWPTPSPKSGPLPSPKTLPPRRTRRGTGASTECDGNFPPLTSPLWPLWRRPLVRAGLLLPAPMVSGTVLGSAPEPVVLESFTVPSLRSRAATAPLRCLRTASRSSSLSARKQGMRRLLFAQRRNAAPWRSKTRIITTILAAATAFACRPALVAGAVAVQRVFVPQRQLIRNVLDLDTLGRDAPSRGTSGMLALFDLRAAFPSVSRTYLNVAVEEVGAPGGLCRIVHGLQDGAVAQFCKAGVVVPLFPIERGVAQGCPLSGMLFCVAIDPFLRAGVVALAKHRGVLRACADDMGAILRRLSHLRALHPVFEDAAKVVGLEARPDKCVLVPLERVPRDATNAEMQRALERAVPAWRAFAIRPAAVYLGYSLGPAAGRTRWDDAASRRDCRRRPACRSGRFSLQNSRAPGAWLLGPTLASAPAGRRARAQGGAEVVALARQHSRSARACRDGAGRMPASSLAPGGLGCRRGADRAVHPPYLARGRRRAQAHCVAFCVSRRVRPRAGLPERLGHCAVCGGPPRGQRRHAAARRDRR